jgi:hypothetical protein
MFENWGFNNKTVCHVWCSHALFDPLKTFLWPLFMTKLFFAWKFSCSCCFSHFTLPVFRAMRSPCLSRPAYRCKNHLESWSHPPTHPCQTHTPYHFGNRGAWLLIFFPYDTVFYILFLICLNFKSSYTVVANTHPVQKYDNCQEPPTRLWCQKIISTCSVQ